VIYILHLLVPPFYVYDVVDGAVVGAEVVGAAVVGATVVGAAVVELQLW
jgi:hypothetical protein